MALEKAWTAPLPSPQPDTSKITSKTDGGVKEKAHYYVTSSDTETILGQKGLNKMIETWLRLDVAKMQKILTSSYVKVITDKLWLDALPYIFIKMLIFVFFMITLSVHIAYVDYNEVNEIVVPMLILFLTAGGVYNIVEIYLE